MSEQTAQTPQSARATRTEEFVISGDKLIATVKRIWHEGDARRIGIKDATGATLIEIPMMVGVIGALLMPTLAAVGAIAALVTDLRIVVERVDDLPSAPARENAPDLADLGDNPMGIEEPAASPKWR